MKRIIKISAYITVSIMTIVVLAAVIIPIIFKDDLKKLVIESAEETVNAELYFDDVNVSLFSHFPKLTAGLDHFGLVGKGNFKGDTIVGAESFDVAIDLLSVISGNYKVDAVYLIRPKINALVREDGHSNWEDIMLDTEEAVEEDTDSVASSLSISIPKVVIQNGKVFYDDKSSPMYALLEDLDYQGNISIVGDLYEIDNQLSIKNIVYEMDGSRYVNHKSFFADLILDIDLDKGHYEFEKNTVKFNDLTLEFDGFVEMSDSADMKMDIDFHTKATSFKNLLSLVPSEYLADYSGLKTKGTIAFDGFFKGLYGDNTMPNFSFGLKVDEGEIQYPDLPLPIKDINIDFAFKNIEPSLEKLNIHLKKFNLNAAGNPFSFTTNTTVNLNDSFELKSLYTDTYFSSLVDFEKLTQSYPLEGMKLKGVFEGDFKAKGSYDFADKIPDIASSLKMNNVYLNMINDPISYQINEAHLIIDSDKIKLEKFNSMIGKSDVAIEGEIEDYLAYGLGIDDAILAGRFNLNSAVFDLNEWMTEDTEEVVDSSSEEPLSVVSLPKDIDFVFNSSIKKLDYSTMPIDNFTGKLSIKKGMLFMDKLSFGMLSGKFFSSGIYDPRDTLAPKYEMNMDIQNLKFRDAYAAFNSVKALVPSADKMEGDFSSKMKFNGVLDTTMFPVYEKLNGSGDVNITECSVKDLNLTKAISKVTKSDKFNNEITVKDQNIDFKIINGVVEFSPFSFKVAQQDVDFSGSQAIAGDINYKLTTNAPKTMGSDILGKIASTDNLKVNIGVKGTFDNPKPIILGVSSSANKTVTSEVKEKIVEKKQEIKEDVKKEIKKKSKSLIKKLF